jgi:2'-5' RNA ligase
VRVFFALWPEEAQRRALHAQAIDIATRTKGRPVALDKLHLTLAFLGDVDAGTIACLAAAAGLLPAENVELEMSRIGCWRKAGIAWMAPRELPKSLGLLRESLADVARGCGVPLDDRPYLPHLTLARGASVAIPESQCDPIMLRFRGFCLVRSDLGRGTYEPIGRWPHIGRQ